MLIKLGSFDANVGATYTDGTKIEAKIRFTGYSYEISVQELCQWMTTEFGLFVQFVKGFFKLSLMVRKELPNWVETYNMCANLAQEGEQYRKRQVNKVYCAECAGEVGDKK